MLSGPLCNATCTMRKVISEPCWQPECTAKQNLFFNTRIFVYITKMLLTAIKLALSASLKTPALVFDWLTSDGAGLCVLSLWCVQQPIRYSFQTHLDQCCGTESVCNG